MCKDARTVTLIETSEVVREKYLAQSRSADPTLLLNAFNLCSQTEQQLRSASHAKFMVELMLWKLAHLSNVLRIVAEDSAEAGEKKNP
jgi:DNA polymerase-3 subunit gamma/tau